MNNNALPALCKDICILLGRKPQTQIIGKNQAHHAQ